LTKFSIVVKIFIVISWCSF